MKKSFWIILAIFLFGFVIRLFSILPANTIVGFDQARDLFSSSEILSGDLKFIGPTAGNNTNLHHGIAWLYFLVPSIMFSKNPISPVIWNSFFNASSAIVLYFIAKTLFKSNKAGYIAAILTSISYYFVSYSGWLSNPTVTLLTVPLFFLGILKYKEEKSWGLPLAFFFLGLSIQFELFFLYLIPTFLILFFVLKLKLPNLKLSIFSILALTLSLSTMIATEIKFGFAGVISLLHAGDSVGGIQKANFLSQFVTRFFETFSQTLFPTAPFIAVQILVIFIILFLIYKRSWFLLVYLLSPAIMLFLGYHNAPWFLIGLPPAIILSLAFVLDKLKFNFLIIIILVLLTFVNFTTMNNEHGTGQKLLEPDKSAILSTQIAAMDYTYQKSAGEIFAIDTITNPLYINAVWAWNYDWYWKRYGYKPTFLGGDQTHPYDTLSKASGKEKYFFIITDQTSRIPPVYKQNAVNSMKKKAKLIEEKEFDGITVSMWKNYSKSL